MKKLLTIVTESQLPECGESMPAQAPMTSAPSGATMNITMNAQGADQIKSLLDIISRADTTSTTSLAPTEPAEPMLPVSDEFGSDDDFSGSDDDFSGSDDDFSGSDDFDNIEDELHDDIEDSYKASTTPDPKYADTEYMTRDLAGGLNKEKRMFKKAQDGDNAMAAEAIKADLRARYSALKEGK